MCKGAGERESAECVRVPVSVSAECARVPVSVRVLSVEGCR